MPAELREAAAGRRRVPAVLGGGERSNVVGFASLCAVQTRRSLRPCGAALCARSESRVCVVLMASFFPMGRPAPPRPARPPSCPDSIHVPPLVILACRLPQL